MSQFLFVAEVPPMQGIDTAPHYPPAWKQFANSADTILKSHRGTSKLQLNAWLLPADHAWPALESLAASATTLHLSYSILQIENALELTNNKPPARATVESLRA